LPPTVPLAVAAPAALASFAYLNAKASLFYDWHTLGSGIGAQIRCAIKEKRDRLSLIYVLEEHAKGKLANEVFLVFEGRQWTYKETYETALKYGTWFKTKFGVKSKEVVAMDFMNGEKFLFVWFGLWSIGAKPAFLNYNLTGKALAHCIGVSTARLVLVDPEFQNNIPQEVRDELSSIKFEIFTPELEAEVMCTEAVRVEDSELSENLAQNMAILIYTSGTTGLPKPAIVSWRKVVLSIYLFPEWMGFTKKDNFYTVSIPLSTTLSLTNSYSACRFITHLPLFWVCARPFVLAQHSSLARSSPPRPSGKTCDQTMLP
jgi:acyl-CoA synthetase (AMP-forming)/AMP-acid ligase II